MLGVSSFLFVKLCWVCRVSKDVYLRCVGGVFVDLKNGVFWERIGFKVECYSGIYRV